MTRKWHLNDAVTQEKNNCHENIDQLRGKCNTDLVPRVSHLPEERPWAGHLSLYTNEIPIGGGSLT